MSNCDGLAREGNWLRCLRMAMTLFVPTVDLNEGLTRDRRQVIDAILILIVEY